MPTFLVFFALNFKVIYCSIIDYRFYNNIGQVFYDYSGNNLHAINGDSHLTQTNDVTYSDRGLYFSNDRQLVSLPPNTLITTGYTLTPPYSIILWFNALETAQPSPAKQNATP